MAVWALLSISQTVKAADVTVYFQCPSDWATPVHVYAYNSDADKNSSWSDAPAGSEFTTSNGVKLWKCTFDSKYKLVIFKANSGEQQYPGKDQRGLDVKDNYVYTSTSPEGTSLSDFENGGTTPSKFTPLYIYGNFVGKGWDEPDGTRSFTTTDGKIYQYEFGKDFTNAFSNNTAEFYFRVKAESKQYAPQTNDDPVGTEYTSAKESNNGAWKFTMTKGKSYTLIFDYEKKQIRYTEGGSSVVTKVIKLLNGTSELTGSNGKYTLNLSGDTSQDATITLTIDGAKYGLATAQTIAAAGTTSGIAFTAEGKEALTLKAGLIYYLSVTKDGKMKVVAKEKGVADGNYYLVGNFFTEDGDDINYDKKYFRFIDNGDGTLSFDIPTTLTVKAQVLASDGKCYGPTKNGNIGIDNPTADGKTVNGNLVEGSHYFTFTDRKLTGDGIYKVTIAVDETGIPTKWTVDFDKTQRMAYFMVDPKEDADAVAHPCYTTKKDNGTSDNKFFGNVYLEANQHCFVVGNIQVHHDHGNIDILKTTPKLYLQGNGGLDITINTDKDIAPGYEKWQYTNVFPNKEGFYFPKAQSLYLEYNPSQGQKTVSDVVAGIAGEVKPANGETPITSIQIVGNGVVDSWELKDAKNMTYNKTLDCWEYSFRTENAENAENKFRFLANGSWAMNWGEESTKPVDQARTPYKDKTEQGHEASETDPNNLSRTTNGTEENRNGDGTFGDMIFNRPAGQWTIRFYIRSVSTQGGNYFKKVYGYTITGSESNDIYLTYRTGKFIRTYSNSKPMNPDNDNVKIYEVYKYEKPAKVDDIYTQGKVYLRRLNYVPANVGVVLIGEVPDDGNTYTDGQKLAFSLLERTEESVEPGGDYRDVWTKATEYKNAGDQWNNYLVPTVTAENDLGNAKVESGKVIYRYFGLGNYYRTNYHTSLGNADPQKDYIGFFRLTANGKSGANKAYLSIPANAEVGNAVGATYGYIDYNGQLLGNKYDDSTIPASLAKMALVFDDFVEGNETTGINELKTEVLNDNKYYNLQGIEVAYPVKGIYIHNGKKVIVK